MPANNEPKAPPTIEELIEMAKADIEKFKVIVSNYQKQNPRKAIAKKTEFAKKMEVKKQYLADLEDIVKQQLNEIEAEKQRVRKEIEDREVAHQAELEKAREEGRKQALKEMKSKE